LQQRTQKTKKPHTKKPQKIKIPSKLIQVTTPTPTILKAKHNNSKHLPQNNTEQTTTSTFTNTKH